MGFNLAFKGLILTAFPQQRWLDERASMLCYTNTACLVSFIDLHKTLQSSIIGISLPSLATVLI